MQPGEDVRGEDSVVSTQPWRRLHRDGSVVGYAREMGSKTFFSKDGYGWNGTPIAYDFALEQLPVRLHHKRLYHGDQVRMAPRAGAQEYALMTVLVADEAPWLWNADESRLMPFTEAWPPPSTPRAKEIVGSMYTDPTEAARIEGSLRHATGSDRPNLRQALHLTGSIVVGLALIVLAQWLCLESVGPVVSSLGALGGSIVYFHRTRRADWYSLRRGWMIKLSFWVGLAAGICLAIAYALFGLADAFSGVVEHPGFAAAVMGVLGGLVGMVATVIGADLVAWRTGGYAGEEAQEQSYRSLT